MRPGPGLHQLFSDFVQCIFPPKGGLECSCGYPQNVVEVEVSAEVIGLSFNELVEIGGCK